MRIDIVSCVPALLESPLSHSILKRAQDKGLLEVHVHDLRDYAEGKQRQVDDYPFGGGAGMVLKVEPVARCIRALEQEREYDEVIYLTPDGKTLDQSMANSLSMKKNLLLLAGHYKGLDQRARDLFVTQEISIGDFVLSGGELPALVLTDAIGRLLPGVLSDESSALFDSFQDNLLDPPIYTRPAEFEGHEVPEVLRSGNGSKIEAWREQAALDKTRKRRPDLLQRDGNV
ncbi:tRNA (guanosine(37)-N1)-methyltransferase TrmD [Pontibacter sp. G13]|uniref:tRNA (guanosine(37)-N1)-methyltransferase TrmD n=1 Tax=Pontibacter sp. G13 TaxID=3074898 RepID=UPI00288C1E18|nr:tRNA (guanosine(37)-N1)-methyltransferase TrmD [Pontibacter sp. G13]WNJ16916.1 tRNA (guanosine(37)-N1)-methyltransferase TrmD [Pontibacter sp. G13]